MRARIAASVALAAALTTGVAGCTFVTPIATMKQYDASDGVSATLGEVRVLNVLAITGDKEHTGSANLVFSAVNSSSDLKQLVVQYRGVDHEVTLEPGRTDVGFGDDADVRVQLDRFRQQAGALAPIYFRNAGEAEQLGVPVLNDSWAEYSDLGPTKAPTATPSATATAPAPTGTATPPAGG